MSHFKSGPSEIKSDDRGTNRAFILNVFFLWFKQEICFCSSDKQVLVYQMNKNKFRNTFESSAKFAVCWLKRFHWCKQDVLFYSICACYLQFEWACLHFYLKYILKRSKYSFESYCSANNQGRRFHHKEYEVLWCFKSCQGFF